MNILYKTQKMNEIKFANELNKKFKKMSSKRNEKK
jgi:hypothetical protein